MSDNAFLKVDCVMLRVSDLQSAVAFYETHFGMVRAWSDQQAKMVGLLFPHGDSELVLHSDPEIPSPDYCFLVASVDDMCAHYAGLGLLVLEGPLDVRTGRFAVLADQDGNRLPIIDLTKFGGVPRYGDT